jgi:hypothetical protein
MTYIVPVVTLDIPVFMVSGHAVGEETAASTHFHLSLFNGLFADCGQACMFYYQIYTNCLLE